MNLVHNRYKSDFGWVGVLLLGCCLLVVLGWCKLPCVLQVPLFGLCLAAGTKEGIIRVDGWMTDGQ